MSTLLVSLDQLSEQQRELASLMDEASNVSVETYGKTSDHRQPLSTLRNIIIHGRRYEDKVASCSCSALRLFTFGEEAYTVCVEHGLQDIGRLRRDLMNGTARNNGHGRKS